jgi:hypothetical protein
MDLINNYASSSDEGDSDIVMKSSPPPPSKSLKRTHDEIGPASKPACSEASTATTTIKTATTKTDTSSTDHSKRPRTKKITVIPRFAPPQVSGKKKKPNVSTEDLEKWNSKKANLRRTSTSSKRKK